MPTGNSVPEPTPVEGTDPILSLIWINANFPDGHPFVKGSKSFERSSAARLQRLASRGFGLGGTAVGDTKGPRSM
jgi:hypothetical protein